MGASSTVPAREPAGSPAGGFRAQKSPRFRFRKPGILPGFGLSLGFAVTYLSLVVLIPLSGSNFQSPRMAR